MFFMGNTSVYNQLAVRDMISSDSLSSLLSTVIYILFFTLVIEGAGMLVLFLSIHGTLGMTVQQEMVFAAFHSISAFCNAGFSTLSENLGNPLVMQHHNLLYITISVLIILGGIGFPILVNFKHIAGYHLKRLFYFIRTGKRDRQRIRHLYNLNTKIVLLTTLILLTGGTIAILLFEWNGAFAGMSMPDKWVQAFFNATCPRTAGFTSIGLTSFSLQSLLLMLLLMFIGGAAQSTAGGVKVNAFAAAVLSLFAVIRGKNRVEVFRRQLSVDSIRRSNATLVMYLMILFLGVFVLSVLEPHASLLALVFECTSALSTVGSSLGLTPALGEAGKLFVSLLMFIGRVGVITIVLGFVPPQKHTKYKYPDDFEEFINILKSSFYEKLPLNDFDGKNLVYLTSCTGVNLEAVKLLFTAQNSVYAANAVEEEIVATSAIESIDFDRSSVRSIMLGNAPKDNQENRICMISKAG